MLKIGKIFAIGVLLSLLFGTTITGFGINTSKNNNITFYFSFSDPEIQEIIIGDESFDKITVNGLTNTFNFNEPCLPMKPVKILLPYGQNFDDLSIETSEKISLGNNYNIELGQHLAPVTTEYELPKQSIQNNYVGIYPGKQYSIIGTYSFRGYKVLFVNLHPVQYEKESGEIYFYKNMDLLIKTKHSSYQRSYRGLLQDREVIVDMVDNPYTIGTYPKPVSLNETFEYIIITSQDFSKSTKRYYSFQDLIQSKINKGLTAGIFTVEDIISNPDFEVNGSWGDNNPSNPFYNSPIIGDVEQFNDEQARIRNFIRYAYTELGTKYVLLGGDADFSDESQNIVPVRCIYANETGLPLSDEWFEEDDIPSDVYYACLDGNFNYDGDERWGEDEIGNDEADIDEADLLSEVWVGRACIDSEDDISNFTMKVINYQNSNDPYLKEVLFVGEHLGFPGVSEWGGNYKDLLIPYIPDDFNLETLYDRDLPYYWTKYDLMDILNTDTPHIINHDGHSYYGYNMRMYTGDVDSLTNDNYFFVYSHGCMAGGFDNPDGYDCIAEHYTVKTSYAAIGGIWNARFGLGSNNTLDSPSGAYDISFFKAIFEENITEMGRASHYSKEDNIPRIAENGMRWCYYETNLFGDPEVSFFNHSSGTPPNKPEKPDGPSSGKPGIKYSYCTVTTDPEGDDVYYWFDWGDGKNSGWIGPFPSGQIVCENHTWSKKGTYEIKVKAKNTIGLQSKWSDPLSVSMPRNKILFLNLFEKFPRLLLLLRYLFSM
ncbi:hypothetical protein AYK24_05995 [Thermoplasmatales archaeon SG8-52-4]|nr:MAG: hypothetical protein AYK24_05995 [Thermoplasmatales archaeon SG8-52-4]